MQRDSTGRTIPNGSSIDRNSNAAVDSLNGRVRVLRVDPAELTALVGDTLVPAIAVWVSGLDSAGRTIPRVVPLYGPFRRDDAVRPLADGRWVATKPGSTRIEVRVMRFAQRPSEDTAMVRAVTVRVVQQAPPR